RVRVQVLAGEEHDLAVEPHPTDGGHGGVVDGAQVQAPDLGADGAAKAVAAAARPPAERFKPGR
ncbi:MAG TPA: hypothetical protein VH479_04785, partial [Acidimicrobiales bacterium]